MKKTILFITVALSALFLLFLAYLSCGGGNKIVPSDPSTVVEGLTLNRNSMTLAVNDATGTLIPTITPQNVANKNIAWSSSDNSVATVSASGVVTPLKAGTATVTATSQTGGKTAECSIEVVDTPISADAVYLNKNELDIAVGGESSLALNFVPARATNQNVIWSSNQTSVATVDSNGFVTAVAEGSAEITAAPQQALGGVAEVMRFNDGGGNVRASALPVMKIMVTVRGASQPAVPATSVEMNQKTMKISVGGNGLLFPTVLPSNATNVNVAYSTSNAKVAAVSSLGMVTGRAPGTATITVTTASGGYKDACTVTVTDATEDPTGVSLNKASMELGGNESERLLAEVSPDGATDKTLYWLSSNPSIAVVSANGTVLGRGRGVATITAETQVGGHKAFCTVTVTGGNVPVTGVSLNKTSASIVVGGTESLTATIAPTDATNKNVTWVSSDTSVATVSGSGLTATVTGVKAGTADIKATSVDGNITATCALTVTSDVPVASVSLNKTSASIVVGESQPLTATIAPATATNKNVTWVSSDPTIATVSPSTPTTGGCTVEGKKAGTATIIVTTEDGDKTASCEVTVIDKVPVTNVTLDKTSATILVGDKETLTATIVPAEATNKAVAWASSATSVATVSGSGLTATVTAVAAGSATITATTQDGSKTATCYITVTSTSVPVDSVTLSPKPPPAIAVSVGGTILFTATILPATANQKVTWASSNTAVATVSNGTVTGVAKGDAVITVTSQDGSKMDTCAVTVTDTDFPMNGVTLNPDFTISVGSAKTLTAIFDPPNATNKNVTWKSSNTSVATVSNGTVTGVAAGTATIIVATQDQGKTATCTVTVNVPVASVSLKKTTSISVNGGKETLTATILPANASNKNVTWVSSDPLTASVTPSNTPTTSGGVVTGVATTAGTAIITATTEDGGKTDTCTVTVAEIPVTGLTLKASTTVSVGGTETLTATVAPASATNQKVTWVSSDPTIAAVTPSTPTILGGTVEGKKAGAATIIAITEDGGHTKTCAVTVVEPVTGVMVAPTTATVSVGAKQTLTATIAPANATNQNVTWASSDISVATVSGSGLTGTVTGVKAGTATITATTADGGKTDTCVVTVPVPVASVSLDKTKTNIIVGGTETLTATVLPANAANQTVTWSSNNTAVATVNATTGEVTGVAVGTATITVKTQDGNKTPPTPCTVTVTSTNVPVDSVTLSPKPATVSVRGAILLTATIAPTTATNQNIASWVSSDTAVATVSGGKVEGKKAGTATITATTADGSKTDTCTVTVNNVAVTGLTLKASTTIRVGPSNAETLTATIAPATATNQNVTWVSSDPSTATVTPSNTPTDSGGTVTGVKAGTATIIALTQDGGFMKTCTVTVVEPVTGVTLSPKPPPAIAVSVGGTILLTATVLPSTANQNVTWETSDASIARVSGGTVTGVKAGEVTITATAQGDSTKKDTCTVTVKNDVFPVTGVSLSPKPPPAIAVSVGGTILLAATVAPANATNKKVTWFSSNDAIATVNNGTVKGVGPGLATIIVLTEDEGKTDTCTVTVKMPVSGVSLNKTSTTISRGGTETLIATVAPANATNKAVVWASNNTAATVNDTTGEVTGVAVGTANITVTTKDGSKTATCVVTVADINFPVTGVSLNKTSTTIGIGATNAETLTAIFQPANATNKQVTWLSNNTAVATVNATTGEVTGVAAGTATITVVTLDGSKTATCIVTVIGP